MIIKLHICRAYVNNSMRKPLTADRCLKDASDLIKRISEVKSNPRTDFRKSDLSRSAPLRFDRSLSIDGNNNLQIMEDSSTDFALDGDERTHFREGAYPIQEKESNK